MRASAKIPIAIATNSAITRLKTLKKWVSCLLTTNFDGNARGNGRAV
jgi:hypothetical protein